MSKMFHEHIQDLLLGKEINIDELNNCEDINGKKCDKECTREELMEFRNLIHNVEVFALSKMYKGSEHPRFHYNKQDLKNLFDGYITDFIHEDFYYDFINDIKDFDIVSSITPVLQLIKNIVENHYSPLTKAKDLKRKDWEKIYNHEIINYKKPISYNYFKKIVSKTPSLIPLLIMEIDLYNQLNKINKSAKLLFGSYFKLDETALLTDILLHKVDCCATSETSNELLCIIASDIKLFDNWIYQPSFALNYWFWIWFYYTFTGNGINVINNIYNKNNELIAQLNTNFGLSPRPNFEKNKTTKKKTPHNAYTREEIDEWIECRDIYNIAIEEFRLLAFILKCKKNKYTYEIILKKLNNLSLDEKQYAEYTNVINYLFNTKTNNWFDSLIDLLYFNYHISYNTLFEDLQLDSLNKFIKYIEENNKKSYALYVIKNNCNITDGKSDKTISNRISEIEYGLSKNTITSISQKEKSENFEKLDEVDKIVELLKMIYCGFNTYLHFSIPENKCLLFNKIKSLENIIGEL